MFPQFIDHIHGSSLSLLYSLFPRRRGRCRCRRLLHVHSLVAHDIDSNILLRPTTTSLSTFLCSFTRFFPLRRNTLCLVRPLPNELFLSSSDSPPNVGSLSITCLCVRKIFKMFVIVWVLLVGEGVSRTIRDFYSLGSKRKIPKKGPRYRWNGGIFYSIVSSQFLNIWVLSLQAPGIFESI